MIKIMPPGVGNSTFLFKIATPPPGLAIAIVYFWSNSHESHLLGPGLEMRHFWVKIAPHGLGKRCHVA